MSLLGPERRFAAMPHSFPESDVDRTRCGHRENGALDPKLPAHLPNLWNGTARSRTGCFDSGGKGADSGQWSSLRQSRLAQPLKTVLGILGILVDGKTFPSINCEPR